MPFPTVKSDPWKKKARRRCCLWSPEFWKRLCDAASPMLSRIATEKLARLEKLPKREDVSGQCVRMISEMNRLLYG
jgi:hypothetical protein